MPTVTDYFEEIRGEVVNAVTAALADVGVTIADVKEMDEPDSDLINKPGIIVWYGGSEGYIGGTNIRDDVGYPFFVGLWNLLGDRPTDGAPGLTVTLFREIMRQKFGNRRAVDVSGIDCYLCQYEPQAPVADPNNPALGQMNTVCGVTVYARVPRGGG